MGDIADAMLEGVLCETCGEYIEGEAPGHPRRCGACHTPDEPESDAPTETLLSEED